MSKHLGVLRAVGLVLVRADGRHRWYRDAPATLVFKAWTTPELVRRWWGFDTSEWLVCDIDLREGGTWRYVTREPGGFEVGLHGEYRTIEAPHRIASGMEGGMQISMNRLEDLVVELDRAA